MQHIEQILKTRIQEDRAWSFLIIAPTDSARLKRQRELVGYHPNRAVANLRVYDIKNFVQRLYDQGHPQRRYISQGLQNLWLYEIASRSDVSVYEPFRPGGDVSDGTLSLVVGTINWLRERGDTAADMVTDTPAARALAQTYAAYEQRLGDKWVDEQGKHLHLAHNFDPAFMKEAFRQVDLVVIEGFTLLSRADIRILTAIAQMPEIEMWFRTDCVADNAALYKNINELIRPFADVGVGIDTDYGRETDLHQHFAETIFRTDTETETQIEATRPSEGATQITHLQPADRSEEVEQIAHLIRQHVAEGDCDLGDICVAYYNVGSYLQRIAETFPAYDIPYSLVETLPLTKSEVVKAIFSRLSEHGTPLEDTYFSKPGSRSGAPMPPAAFQEYVERLLREGEVIQHILNPMLAKNSEIVQGEIEAYHQFNRIVKELCNVLSEEGARTEPLERYVERLRRIAKHTTYQNTASAKGATVRIVPLSELRSQAYDTVFLGDFVEGGFPRAYRPDPLLPETPYRTETEQLHDDRFMFYRVLKSFRKRLYLLTPKREGESELIASPFLAQLQAVASVKEIEKIADPTQGSRSGFLSAYGTHVWTTPDVTSDATFPEDLRAMQSLIQHVGAVEKSREVTHDHLAHEGLLADGDLSAENRERLRRLRKEKYSVTYLETYGKCPFQYFVSQILSLPTEEEEAEDEPSALEKGTLLHKVLKKFYEARQKIGTLQASHWSDFEAAKEQLHQILATEAEQARAKRSTISEGNLFWNTEIQKLRVILNKWLDAERAYPLNVVPADFEVEFEEFLPSPDSGPNNKVCLQGKIDRIDIGGGNFNVVDYKSGSGTIRIRDIQEGRALQIPVYLMMADLLLKSNGETGLQPAAGLYYKTRLAEFSVELGLGKETLNERLFQTYNGTEWKKFSKSGQLLADADFEALLARVSGYVHAYVNWISEGVFPLITRVDTFVDSEAEGDTPLTPRNKTAPCSYCQYKRGCRVGAVSETSASED